MSFVTWRAWRKTCARCMPSLCFVCQLPIISHPTWGIWPYQPDSDTEPQDDEPQKEEEEDDPRGLASPQLETRPSQSRTRQACRTTICSSIASVITRYCRSPQEARTPA
ncbi:hypothetical protein MTO96_008515 [Rhipicephalus appendiculatus]